MRARRSLVLVATILMMTGPPVGARAQSGYEPAPTLKASDIAPPILLKGARFRVADKVPVKGLLGNFTIQSDFGKLEAHGLEMLRIRVTEVGALDTLENTSKSEEFLKAAGTAAARPFKAGAHMVMNPKETAQGISAGASRFYDRVKIGKQHVEEAGSDPSKSDTEKAEEVSKRVGSVTIDVLGWEEERRALAKRLGVDPYTTNVVLAEQLSDFAWVTFSGRVGLNLLVAVVVPFSTLLTATSITNDMVWDLKPVDVLKADAEKLATMGASAAQVKALMKNPWYSLTMLTWLTNGLGTLDGVTGRAGVIGLAATARSEDEARFLATAVNMLAGLHATAPLASLAAQGMVTGRMRAGAVAVPAPVDYIAWTQNVATFARRADLKGKQRGIWTTGRFSPRAKKEFAALGWGVHEVAPITPPAVKLPTTSR